jgi:3'-5' exoribonuclease
MQLPINKNIFVKDLADGIDCNIPLLVAAIYEGTTRQNRKYLTLKLMDRSGTVTGKVWNDPDRFLAKLARGKVAVFNGKCETFNDSLQLKVINVFPVNDSEVDMSLFVPASERSGEAMLEELRSVIATVADPDFRAMTLAALAHPRAAAGLVQATAAKSFHHAYAGGLLEHTLSVVRLADLVAGHYGKRLNRSLLISGAALHDIGKVWEFTEGADTDYTTVGRLLGHLVSGPIFLAEVARDLPGFPEEKLLLLQHMLASHHGTRDMGAAVEPKIMEGWALHFLDNMDGKMARIDKMLAAETKPESSGAVQVWSSYDRLLDSHFMRTPRYGEDGDGGGARGAAPPAGSPEPGAPAGSAGTGAGGRGTGAAPSASVPAGGGAGAPAAHASRAAPPPGGRVTPAPAPGGSSLPRPWDDEEEDDPYLDGMGEGHFEPYIPEKALSVPPSSRSGGSGTAGTAADPARGDGPASPAGPDGEPPSDVFPDDDLQGPDPAVPPPDDLGPADDLPVDGFPGSGTAFASPERDGGPDDRGGPAPQERDIPPGPAAGWHGGRGSSPEGPAGASGEVGAGSPDVPPADALSPPAHAPAEVTAEIGPADVPEVDPPADGAESPAASADTGPPSPVPDAPVAPEAGASPAHAPSADAGESPAPDAPPEADAPPAPVTSPDTDATPASGGSGGPPPAGAPDPEVPPTFGKLF